MCLNLNQFLISLTLVFPVLVFRDDVPLPLPRLVLADSNGSVVESLMLVWLLICLGCCFWEVITTEPLPVTSVGIIISAFFDVEGEDETESDFLRRCGTRPGNSSRRSRASK